MHVLSRLSTGYVYRPCQVHGALGTDIALVAIIYLYTVLTSIGMLSQLLCIGSDNNGLPPPC